MSVIAPNLRFSRFDRPWQAKTLGDLMTFKNGVNADKSMYGSGRKFINVLDVIASAPITHDRIIGSVTVSDKEFAKNEVQYGDILFQRSSETREEVGQSNVYLDKDETATFGGFVIRGRATTEFDPMFFHALLKTDKVRDDMTSRSGGSTRYNIGQDSLASVTVHIPTLPEQQKIAAFLGAVDAKLAALAARQAALARFKAGLMQKLFSQQLRFSRDDGKAFPDWEEKRLGEVVDYEQPTKYLVSSTDYSDDFPTPVLTAGKTFILGYTDETHGIYNGPFPVIIFDDFTTSSKFVEFPFKAKSSAMKILRASSTDMQIKIVFELLQMLNFSPDSHQRHWISKFSEMQIMFPHPDEQAKIADALSAMDAKIQAVADQVAKLQTFKKGLLQQMFV